MVYRPNIDEQLCFVLMPFQELHQQYFRGILEPAAKLLGLRARKADDIYGTAPIIQDIWELIWTARVVIADVTNKNPNVNYELGICHALGVPTVLITQDIGDVPFDYRHLRCIVYDTKQVDWQDKLKLRITETIKAILERPPFTDDLRWPYDTSAMRASGQSGPFVPAEEARETLSHAIRQGADSISRALGLHGTSVLALSQFGSDVSYRSGFAIASAMSSSDPLTRQGLEQVRAISREAAAELGDGTKTATLIFCEMVLKGFTHARGGAVLRDLVNEMDLAVEFAVNFLTGKSQIASVESCFAVAITAALADQTIGRLAHGAITKAGKDGVVLIEDSADPETLLFVREGMYFDRGFVSRKFITDEPRQVAVLENPYVLLYADRLVSMRILLPLLEQIARAGRSLLLIADEIEGEALATLLANQLKGTLSTVGVRAPGSASRQELLEDIAIATGGTVIGNAYLLEQSRLSQLGQTQRVEVSSESTWLVGGAGKREQIESRAAGIRHQISVAAADFEKEKLQERLAKLVGATAVIHVGGASIVDREERKYRIQTAFHSIRSAMAGGTLPGGGTALWRASRELRNKYPTPGGNIVADALAAPLLAQIKNARGSHEEVIREMESPSEFGKGFDALKRVVSDLPQSGILDSTNVVLRGVQIAFAHARKVLQTGAWEISQAPGDYRVSSLPPRDI